jgi:hypothetical protein
MELHLLLTDPHNLLEFSHMTDKGPPAESAEVRCEGGECVKVYRRLVVAIGSIVAMLLAGGATWKVG